MRKFITLLIYFSLVNCYSQSKDTIYFLIKKSDTLIKKQIAIKKNSFEGYKIYYTQKKKVIMNNTPVVKGKIWGEDSKYDYEVLKYVSVNFNFQKREDEIISKKELKILNPITSRDVFLNLKKQGTNFETLGFVYYFIEETECENKYILRKTYPITFE
ncbi:MAG: hypothetical protein ACKVK4_04310 [Flavobacteriales bacterium]|jgi:hypothetical protein